MCKLIFVSSAVLVAGCFSAGLKDGKDTLMTSISNKRLTVEIVNPNVESIYRGPRFEWSGMVSQVTLDGKHTFCRAASQHDPIVDGVGLAEEASEPLGFNEVGADGEFVKLGVGVLRRVNREPYGFWKKYPVVDAPAFSVKTQKRSITHVQTVSGPRGWAYRYTKTVALHKDDPVLTISHGLENIGTKPIKTTQYNHNFLLFNAAPIGPDYSMTLGFDPVTAEGTDFRGIVELDGNTLLYPKVYEGKPLFVPIKGHNGLVEQNRIVVENRAFGTGVRIEGDFPLEKVYFFTTPQMICPEPFIAIRIEPGQTQQWTRKYTFFAK